jgi:hypothetical protein
MNHVAATFAMGLNDPTPAKGRNGTAGARVLVRKKGANKLLIFQSSKSKCRF